MSMKPVKTFMPQHRKNQRSLTIEFSRQLAPRQHHSNPRPRPTPDKPTSLTSNHKYLSFATTNLQPSKNFLKLKTDMSVISVDPVRMDRLRTNDLKNTSLAKIMTKRRDVINRNKQSCDKLRERRQRQRLSIDVYTKGSPNLKSLISSTKGISRRKSTMASKLRTQPQTDIMASLLMNPRPSKDVLKAVGSKLSEKQACELSQVKTVYFFSRKKKQDLGEENNGYDDRKGFYICETGDHISYRFQIVSKLGKGSFGDVVKAYDHKKKETVALKIIRNRKTPNSQALIQYGILRSLNSGGATCQNIVRVYQAFHFRNHFCMTFQLLSFNLYDLLKSHNFTPFSSELIRRLAIQVLSSLIYLRRRNIIHCDIKPQNILLKQADKSGIKLVDFGSSCYSDERMYSYIQSRYYRAPEVILGMEYGFEIDMWSFACVMAEMKLTYPLFGGEDETQQVGLISEVIGLPDKKFYSRTSRGAAFFEKGTQKDRQGQIIVPGSRALGQLFSDADFIDFLSRILVWQPSKRMGPIEALRHQWILKGIPQNIRNQHLQYLVEEQTALKGTSDKRQSSTLSQEILVKK